MHRLPHDLLDTGLTGHKVMQQTLAQAELLRQSRSEGRQTLQSMCALKGVHAFGPEALDTPEVVWGFERSLARGWTWLFIEFELYSRTRSSHHNLAWNPLFRPGAKTFRVLACIWCGTLVRAIMQLVIRFETTLRGLGLVSMRIHPEHETPWLLPGAESLLRHDSFTALLGATSSSLHESRFT